MDDIYNKATEINQMRKLMKAVHTEPATPSRPIRNRPQTREHVEARIVSLTEHLYKHMQPLGYDDFEKGLQSRTNAVLASQAVDELAGSIRRGDSALTLELSRELYRLFEKCDDLDWSRMLEEAGFSGEEYDVMGLINMLEENFAQLDDRSAQLTESTENSQKLFGDLVKDLAKLVNEWSFPKPITEHEEGARDAPACAQQVMQLLESRYGISVELRSGS